MSEANEIYRILVISDYREINSSRPEAEIFIRLVQMGHTVHILTHPGATYYNERFRSFGILVVEQHPERKAYLPYIRFLRQFIREGKYDFVHAFNSHGLTNAIWAMIGLDAKLIAYRGYAGHLHWYDPMMYVKYFHPRVDHIICLSDEIRTILSRHMPWGKFKLTTIPKGHDPGWYDYVPRIDRASMGFSENDILLTCVANVRPFKGIKYLMQATYLIPPEIPLHILCIGRGYEVGTVKSLIDDSPLTDRIHLLGYRKDALSIVKMADASILTSTHGEALTKSVIEAMCLGTPPIITNIPGNDGLVEDGVSGWIIQTKDPTSTAKAIIEMAGDPHGRKRRGKNATERILKYFHTDETVRRFLKLYEKLKS